MTRQDFIASAVGQPFTLANLGLTASPEIARTGSCGFVWRGSLYVRIGAEWVQCLASVRLTAVGSKKWKPDLAPPPPTP